VKEIGNQRYGPECPLTACRAGGCFLVQAVQGEGARRLRDVGVCEGAQLNMLKNRGDVIVRVAGCRVGLREEVACKIFGTPVLIKDDAQGS